MITVEQTKTGVFLTIPILPDLSKALTLLKHKSGPILRTDDGKNSLLKGLVTSSEKRSMLQTYMFFPLMD